MDQPLTLITSISLQIPISETILALSNIPVQNLERKVENTEDKYFSPGGNG